VTIKLLLARVDCIIMIDAASTGADFASMLDAASINADFAIMADASKS
jgi:hypothetical protein